MSVGDKVGDHTDRVLTASLTRMRNEGFILSVARSHVLEAPS
jgi:hypothetical protein